MAVPLSAQTRPPLPAVLIAMWPGLLLCAAIALTAWLLAQLAPVRQAGLSALPLAILLGMVIGNVAGHKLDRLTPGIAFAKGRLLRLAIVLFGFHITWQQIGALGLGGIALAITIVVSTLLLAVLLGTRLLGLNNKTSLLIGAGSAICGAAAVLATEPVVRAKAEQVTIAVATVVVFGTLAMFLYPVLYPYLSLDDLAYGQYVGATIHEVAQVVVAGEAISLPVLQVAVIEKMLRVLLLAPFLMVLSLALYFFRPGHRHPGTRAPLHWPWFALGFVAVAGFNSLQILPPVWVQVLIQLDALLLTLAMAALGLTTQLALVRQAGWRPILLAGMLAIYLLLGGYGLSLWWL